MATKVNSFQQYNIRMQTLNYFQIHTLNTNYTYYNSLQISSMLLYISMQTSTMTLVRFGFETFDLEIYHLILSLFFRLDHSIIWIIFIYRGRFKGKNIYKKYKNKVKILTWMGGGGLFTHGGDWCAPIPFFSPTVFPLTSKLHHFPF